MIYLLDVNVLLALRYPRHELHVRAIAWLAKTEATEYPVCLATCSITELGFIRVGSGPAGWAPDVSTAIEDLQCLKNDRPMLFLNDGVSGDQLPDWVQRPKHVTDGHLLRLAAVHGGSLVTLDGGIPGAILIRPLAPDHSSVREPVRYYGAAA